MANTVQEIYKQFISTLPPTKRLQLVTLILNGLVEKEGTAIDSDIDDSNTWTDQDQLDLATYSLQYAATAFPEGEELVE